MSAHTFRSRRRLARWSSSSMDPTAGVFAVPSDWRIRAREVGLPRRPRDRLDGVPRVLRNQGGTLPRVPPMSPEGAASYYARAGERWGFGGEGAGRESPTRLL